MQTFKEFIDEKWTVDITLAGFGQPATKKTVPIYENPTSSDLTQLAKDGLSSSRRRSIPFYPI